MVVVVVDVVVVGVVKVVISVVKWCLAYSLTDI
jgi:hypothetical protein